MNGEIKTTMDKYVDPITSTHGANRGKFSCCPFGSSNPLGLLVILAYLVVLLFSATLEAQSGAGSIQGTVRDATKAVIPNAAIVVTNTATGVQQSTVTNGIGFYSVPSLFAGPYTVMARAANMKEWKTSLTLEVGQAATIDATLAVGTSTQVTVVGDQTSLIDYNSQTVATDLERQRIEQLPLNGRVLSSLVVESTPGVEGSAQAVDVNGTVENAQEYVLDGAVISNMDSGGITLRQPDPDSIQEVRIETSASSAKYDLPSTTVLTTRSGTNQYRGSIFETNRDNSYGIARTRASGTNYVAPKLIRNEFGGSVGGPIRIPHFYNGHDKAFFFIAWEDEEFRGDDLQALFVPTLAMRQGNFGGLTTSGGQPFTIYDPSTTQANGTRSPFNYGGPSTCTAAATATCTNTINPAEISPLAKYLYSISPLPTLPTVDPYVGPNFTGTTPHYIHAPTFSGRGDYRLNEHNSFYVRGSETFYQIHDLNETAEGPPTTDGVANITDQPTYTYSGAFGWSRTFSPTFFSEFVISQNWETDKVETGPDPTHDYDAQFGLPDPFNVLGYPVIEGQSTGNGQTSMLEDYETADNSRSDTTQILQIDENLTKVLGKHQLTFGGRYRRDHIDVVPDEAPNGSTVQYDSYGTGQFNTATAASGAYTAVTNTGLAAADFFIGNADAYTTAKLHIPFQFVNQEVAGYMQDDWHVRSNLTLNLGLRYEAHPTPREKNNSDPGFDFNTQSIVLGEPISQLISTGQTTQAIVNSYENAGVKFETTQAAGLPDRMVYSNDLNFAPRVGAAWRIFGDRRSTVFRGGFGSYLYPVPVRNFYFSTYTDPPYTASLTDNLTLASQAGTDGLPNYILRSKQTLVTGANTANLISASGNPVINNASIGQSFLDPHSPVSVVKNGNVTLEQQLKDNLVVRVSYVVSQGNHLEQNWNYNTPPPAYVQYVNTDAPLCTATNCANIISPVYGSILEQRRTGYSTDNSGQINLQRTYSKGYAYQIFYVFSSAFRNGGNAFRDSIVYPLQDYANGTAPASLNAENREANYLRNTGIPVHRIRWNFVVDSPIGRGKKYFANMPRWLDEVVGGFQIAGDGTVHSQEFALTATNYGPTAPLVIYKHAHPILDCRSGICYKGYQYFNGYISPTQINAPNGVTGLDTANQPYQCPVDTRPTVTSGPACGQPIPSGVTVTNPDFNTNDVVGGIPLSNGTIAQNVAVEPGPSDYGNPYVRKIIQGPFIFNEDLSIFKVFPIRGRVNFKVNLDAFNVFNNQGDASPDATTGLQEFTTSVNGARQLQISGRLSF